MIISHQQNSNKARDLTTTALQIITKGIATAKIIIIFGVVINLEIKIITIKGI
jgi:hypothetical protein